MTGSVSRAAPDRCHLPTAVTTSSLDGGSAAMSTPDRYARIDFKATTSGPTSSSAASNRPGNSAAAALSRSESARTDSEGLQPQHPVCRRRSHGGEFAPGRQVVAEPAVDQHGLHSGDADQPAVDLRRPQLAPSSQVVRDRCVFRQVEDGCAPSPDGKADRRIQW